MPTGEGSATTEERLLGLSSSLWADIVSRPTPTTPQALWKEHLMIRQLLDAMRQINPPADLFPDRKERLANLDAFLKWCDKMDIVANRVTVAPFTHLHGEFGLKATGEIAKDDTLATVPRRAILSYDDARKSSVLRKACESDPMLGNMENVGLSVFLLCELLNADSKWRPYLDVLPTCFATPLYFTESQMQMLRPSPAFEDALKMYRSIARQFAYFHLMLKPKQQSTKSRLQQLAQSRSTAATTADNVDIRPKENPLFDRTPLNVWNFTFDAYLWAVSAVSTRLNLVPSSELTAVSDQQRPRQIPALIPFLDMANHGDDDEDEWTEQQRISFYFCPETNCAGCQSTDDHKFGDHITIWYGLRSNVDHLIHNGFVPKRNPNNYLRIKLGISKTDPSFRVRISALDALGFSEPENGVKFDLKPGADPIPTELVRFSRIFVADVADGKLQNPESDAVRLKAWTFLRDRFQLLSRVYDTSTMSPPSNGDRSNGSVMESIQRLLSQERDILITCAHVATTAMTALGCPSDNKATAVTFSTQPSPLSST